MERFARTVLRHRRLVSGMWLVLFVLGGWSASQLSERLTFDFSLPGQPGNTAEQQIIESYGVSTSDTYVAVVTVPVGESVLDRRGDVAAVYQAVERAVPGIRVIGYPSTGDQAFLTDDERTTFALIQGPPPQNYDAGLARTLGPVVEKAAAQSGLDGGLTSYVSLSEGGEGGGPSVLAETLLGGAGALIVLLFVFASFLSVVPLLIAAVSILTTFLIVLGLTTVSDVNFVVQFLISLIGLGVAIDYSLLLVSRWREERAAGRDNEDAVIAAMQTAGHAVLASGGTVAISLVALIVLPVPFLRSMGIGGMLIPLVSVAVVLTLLPAMLSSIGPRIDWPRIRHEGTASRGWTAWAQMIVRRRGLATLVAVVLLGLLIAPVFGLKIGNPDVASLARNGPAFDTLATLTSGGVGDGVLTPIEVLVPADQAEQAAEAARGVDGVQLATVGADSADFALIDVVPQAATVDSTSNAVVDAVRVAVEKSVDGEVLITGVGATVEDYFTAVYDKFPYLLALIALITYLLLVRTFRSVLLPLQAVLLNLVSLAAAFGAVVFFWQLGNGSDAVFDISATGAITFWLPG
ncbi:MAG: MMPL family transporter [Nocardioides sp.]